MSYKLLSSDSHVIEPPDLWQQRIDPQFRERAPRLVHEGPVDQWYVDGDVKMGIIGASISAGQRFQDPSQLVYEGRYEDVPLGGYDPHAHVKDMDQDGIECGVLYPTIGLHAYKIPDSGLSSAVCRAYNDWVADFCNPYPDRLKGIALLNIDDVQEGVRELECAVNLGLAGAMIPIRSLEHPYNHPQFYEPLWAAAQDMRMPLSLHTGTFRAQPGATSAQIDVQRVDMVEFTNREYHVRNAAAALVFSGAFERYPDLRVGIIEFELAWVPYFIRSMDNAYSDREVGFLNRRFKGSALPSDFFRRNMFVSFQEDDLGVALRHHIGVDNLLWGSDYSHSEATFPKSQEIVARILDGVPEDEAAKIAGGNTSRIYGLN